MSDTEKVKAPKPLTEKMVAVLRYLDSNAGSHFASDIAAGVGLTDKQVNPICTTLVARGFIAKGEKGTKKVTNKKGVEEDRQYNTYMIVDSGSAAIADAE